MNKQAIAKSKLFVAAILIMLACNSALAQAQTQERDLTIFSDLVRFVAPAEIQEMRIEIFSSTGEMIFDSGFIAGQTQDWPLQNMQGKPVESGLYAYLIIVKDQAGVFKQIRQGNVIIDREREGAEPAPPIDRAPIKPQGNIHPLHLGTWDIDHGKNPYTINTSALGIATQFPLTRLHVGVGATAPLTAGSALLIEEKVATGLVVKSALGGEMFLFQDNINGLLGTVSDHPLGIRTNNLNRLWITSEGNVGIGTTTPNSPLTVGGMIESTSGGVRFPDGSIQTTAAGNGAITGVTAGEGLSGGGSSGNVTLSLALSGVLGKHIASKAVSSEHIADKAVSSGHIADKAISSAHIADKAVSSSHIADKAVSSAHIADKAVSSAHIADSAVRAEHVAPQAIRGEHISAKAVSGAHIADKAVVSAHIADSAVKAEHVAPQAIRGEHIAAKAVSGEHIADKAVSGAKIADKAVSSEQIADKAVKSAQIADKAVASAQIADKAIASAQIADQAVNSVHIAPASVNSVHIGPASVNSVHISPGAVNSVHIGPASINSVHIAPASVNSAHIHTPLLLTSADEAPTLEASHDSFIGIKGTSDRGIGMLGQTARGIGVAGSHSDITGGGPGVYGETNSTDSNAPALVGKVNSQSPGSFSAGVRGINQGTAGSGIGVYGSQDGSGWGVYGHTPDGRGVYGDSPNGKGVVGSSGSGFAMQAIGNTMQSIDKGGWVKAMFRYTGAGNSCFRGDSAAAGSAANTCDNFVRTVGPGGAGESIITFPFNVSDRFVLVTPQWGGSFGVTVTIEFPAPNQVQVRTWSFGSATVSGWFLVDSAFTLVVL
jgi:hypothetical protein